MASAEQIAAKAQQVEEAEATGPRAKHFDQPGVRFSQQRLREEELDRSQTVEGWSFRKVVEISLLCFRAILFCNAEELNKFVGEVKALATDWDKKHRWTAKDISEMLKEVLTAKGGAAAGAARAREEAYKKEIADLKAMVAQLSAGKAKA